MEELELYKLLATEDNEYGTVLVDELGWISDDEFLVWINYLWIQEFIESLKKIFGESLFDFDDEINCALQSDGVCIDLVEMLEGYNIDFKKLFPVDRYRH